MYVYSRHNSNKSNCYMFIFKKIKCMLYQPPLLFLNKPGTKLKESMQYFILIQQLYVTAGTLMLKS